MSIFGIMGMSLLLGLLGGAITGLILAIVDCYDTTYIWVLIVTVILFIVAIPIGIGINTDYAEIYASEFEASKTTIEDSLDSDTLSGLERVELVNKAVDLNREFANKKANARLWHVVYFKNDIFENLEPIRLK